MAAVHMCSCQQLVLWHKRQLIGLCFVQAGPVSLDDSGQLYTKAHIYLNKQVLPKIVIIQLCLCVMPI